MNEERIPVAGVILAGGLSRRMGGVEKSLLELDGKPLVVHVRDRLARQTDSMLLNANGDPARHAQLGLPVAADSVPGFAGPLAGVLAGMDHVAIHAPKCRFIVTAAADTPFFPADMVERFLKANPGDETTIVLARSGGNRHPVFAMWPVCLREPLRAFLNGSQGGKVLLFVDRYKLREVDFDQPKGDLDPFFNINTPQDLAEAETHLERMTT
ncbi:MAG: molybdenum cofactor guanylyltransferase MobA [Rhizobiaceae bacterium]